MPARGQKKSGPTREPAHRPTGVRHIPPTFFLVLAGFKMRRNLKHGDLSRTLLVAGLSAAIYLPPAPTVDWLGAVGYGPCYALPLSLWLGP